MRTEYVVSVSVNAQSKSSFTIKTIDRLIDTMINKLGKDKSQLSAFQQELLTLKCVLEKVH